MNSNKDLMFLTILILHKTYFLLIDLPPFRHKVIENIGFCNAVRPVYFLTFDCDRNKFASRYNVRLLNNKTSSENTFLIILFICMLSPSK